MLFAISETVQLALINNAVPIITVLISAGGAIASWKGLQKTGQNSHGIEAVKEAVQVTSSQTLDNAVEAKKAAVEAKETLELTSNKIEGKLDESLQASIQHAVEAATSQMQLKHDKEVADLKKQLAEARISGDRRKVL